MQDQTPSPTQTDPQLPAAVARAAASVCAVPLRHGSASAVLWQPGMALASASALGRHLRHAKLEVLLPSGEARAAELRGFDLGTDVAALALDSGEAPPIVPIVPAPAPEAPAAAAARAARVGDFVFAVGRSAAGLVQASFGHIGQVGGAWRSWRGGRIDELIRLDGGLYPGLEGAALCRADGTCLGLASSAFSRHHGVVLPAATLDRVAAALLAHGHVPQPSIGIAAQPARAVLDGQGVDGLLVSSLAEGGPAGQAGVLVGDTIVAADGQPTPTVDALREAFAGAGVGRPVVLQVARGGHAVRLEVTAVERSRRDAQDGAGAQAGAGAQDGAGTQNGAGAWWGRRGCR